MASNNGQRLAVFGLSMSEHHTLQMQQILRSCQVDLPPVPGSRAALYLALFNLAKDLDEEESQAIEAWIKNGGPFPTPERFIPVPKSAEPSEPADVDEEEDGDLQDDPRDEDAYDSEQEDEGPEWQRYDEQAFNQDHGAFANDENDRGNFHGMGHRTEGATQNNSNGTETTIRNEEASESSSELSLPYGENYEPADPFETGEVIESSTSNAVIDTRSLVHGGGVNEDTDDEREAEASGSSTPTSEEELECGICYVNYPISDFAPEKITSTCAHDHHNRACLLCVKQSIASTLSQGALHRLNCVWCPEIFSKEEVKKYGSEESYARYEYLLLLANPSITMCLNPHCSSGQVHTDTENPRMVCKECTFAICALHKIPWHENQTCAEFERSSTAIQRLEEAEATAKLLASDESKICPSCGEGITKIDGCDHLSCRCGQDWCFLCLADWGNIMRIGNSAHALSCPYNPNHQGSLRSLNRNNITMNDPRAQNLTNLIHGGPISSELAEARFEWRQRQNAKMRVEAREAAEKRLREMEASKGPEVKKKGEAARKKRKVNLLPAWEEGGVRKRAF
ncbi:hypothetical protein HYFRA_00000406 [Hymenoscyphus fraxineus]|uniref:RBR-type E3 ubiquitin transferase n=1 Tax=Hymenoscyphus fraxineus TaxID=746836 RepID=A0A9N9L6U5_9HELO|nr:hypothetical protein HYFRA_00000406 [Hymenoscyphus fraxineus]